MTDVSDALAEGESVRERLPLRTGGAIAVTDDHLFVLTQSSSGDGTDSEVTRVAFDDVTEVTIEEFDYFLAILSVLLVGYGLYSVPRSVPIGFAFAGFGAASLYWTYRKRGKTRVEVVDRPKPLSVFPEDTGSLYDALEPLVVSEAESEDEESDNDESANGESG